jgi:hypothetical protein
LGGIPTRFPYDSLLMTDNFCLVILSEGRAKNSRPKSKDPCAGSLQLNAL